MLLEREAIEYDFGENLRMSSGIAASTEVAAILRQKIPGAVACYQAAKANDRQGVDWWVELSTCKHLAVDVKVRREDFAAKSADKDDLALETWSVVGRAVGWTRDDTKRCDYVLWLWQDTRRFCLLPFPLLCFVFKQKWEHWAKLYGTSKQETKRRDFSSYYSECVFVPRKEVWREIYRQFAGEMPSGGSA